MIKISALGFLKLFFKSKINKNKKFVGDKNGDSVICFWDLSDLKVYRGLLTLFDTDNVA